MKNTKWPSFCIFDDLFFVAYVFKLQSKLACLKECAEKKTFHLEKFLSLQFLSNVPHKHLG